VETSPSAVGGRIRLPGLDPERRYELVRRDEVGEALATQTRPPDWYLTGRSVARGSVFEQIGLPAPLLNPGQAIVLHLRAL
jgi:alpha-galactosidase